MKKKEICNYLLRNVYWGLWTLWVFQNLLFCSVPGLTGEQSLWLLRGLVAAGICMGLLVKQRNGLGIFVSIAGPVGIYYMLSLWEPEYERIANVMGWTCGLSVCYMVLVTRCYIRDKVAGRTHERPRKCAFGCFMGARTLFAFGMAAMLFFASVDLLPMDVAHHRELSTHPNADRSSHSELIEQNIDELLCLQPDVWRSLDLDQRLNVLRVAAQIECTSLGIPQVRVRAISMEADTMGGYDHASRTVMLSLEHLAFDPVEEVLDTLCHEVRHAYQHCLVEVYQGLDEQERALALFNDIDDYAYEFNNYISGSGEGETFQDYFKQKCEEDSHAFAARAVMIYYNELFMHIDIDEFEEVPLA